MIERRVLHLLGSAQPDGTGIAKVVSGLARGLKPAGYRLDACFLGSQGPLIGELASPCDRVSAIGWSGGARSPRGAWAFLQHLRPRHYDLVHQHCGGRSARWLARFATHAPLIVHIHGRGESSGTIEQEMLRDADAVIANSLATARGLDQFSPSVVYPATSYGQAISRRHHEDGRLVIGAAGRLVHVKGYSDLVHAAAILCKDLPAVQFEIAGAGPEAAHLYAEAMSLGIGSRISFLGWVPDLQQCYSRWDIFVQPSLQEGFGIAALEAMACGVPVVASAIDGLAELVENGMTGLLTAPGDPNQLAQHIRTLLLDPSRRLAMGVAGQTRVKTQFSMDRMVCATAEIYEQLLSERGQPSRQLAGKIGILKSLPLP